jgi:hypothetical protein
MVCIFDPVCELLPPWMKELYLCTVAPLLYLLSYLLPPPPKVNVLYIQTVCGCGGVLKCTVDHILQEFYTLFLTVFRIYKIASKPLTKMTSKDNIKGLVSLKFLRPWWVCFLSGPQNPENGKSKIFFKTIISVGVNVPLKMF